MRTRLVHRDRVGVFVPREELRHMLAMLHQQRLQLNALGVDDRIGLKRRETMKPLDDPRLLPVNTVMSFYAERRRDRRWLSRGPKVRDALGHVPGRAVFVSLHGSATLAWQYINGLSPAAIARMHGVQPEDVLAATRQAGCPILKVNGLGWRDAQNRPGPDWNASIPWDAQASTDQQVVFNGRATRARRAKAAGAKQEMAA